MKPTQYPPTASANPKFAWQKALWIAAFAALIGTAAGSLTSWWPWAQELILRIGNAHLAIIENGQTRGGGKSQYLVVLRAEASMPLAHRYFETNSGVEYAGTSIYPHSLRVAFDVPVTQPKRDLEAQPFVSMMLPVTPLLFCH